MCARCVSVNQVRASDALHPGLSRQMAGMPRITEGCLAGDAHVHAATHAHTHNLPGRARARSNRSHRPRDVSDDSGTSRDSRQSLSSRQTVRATIRTLAVVIVCACACVRVLGRGGRLRWGPGVVGGNGASVHTASNNNNNNSCTRVATRAKRRTDTSGHNFVSR